MMHGSTKLKKLRFDVSCSYESRILRLPQGEQALSVAAVGMRSRFHRDGYIFVSDVKNAVLSVVGPYLIYPALAFTNGGYLDYAIQSSCLVLSHENLTIMDRALFVAHLSSHSARFPTLYVISPRIFRSIITI